MRLIDADMIEPHEHLESFGFGNGQAEFAMVAYMDDIDALPTVDAVPVVHGRWIGGELGHCSVCGHEGCASDIWDGCKRMFCPNCGARLKDGKDDDNGRPD